MHRQIKTITFIHPLIHKVMANEVYNIISEKIASALESGVCPWHKPWSAKGQCYMNRKGQPYSFLNTLLLMAQGKPEGEFITLNQCNAEGGKIKKGAKSAIVTFYTKLVVKDKSLTATEQADADNEDKVKTIPYLKYYRVFHISDCEGIEPKHETEQPTNNEFEPIAAAEELLNAYLAANEGLTFAEDGGNRAYYSPTNDSIHVPKRSTFESIEEFYSTSFHECIHSTGHEDRLNRPIKNHFGDVAYSEEELVAEIGSACAVFHCGIECDKTFNNSVAYLQGWAEKLRSNPKWFAVASARAEKAYKYLIGERESASNAEGDAKPTKTKKVA